jgi:diacylglycerol kinase (ATP)
MTATPGDFKGRGGFRRLANALRYSAAGFRHAIRHEVAIREELIVLAILVPVSAVLPISNLEHLILVLTMMLVVLVEFLNSAIESAVDRVSLERHPLAARAKDLGSAAVLIAVLMWGLSWVVIVGPLAVRWCKG